MATKPWEETWTWAPQYQHIETPEGGDIGIYVDDRVLDEGEKARLRLAAQAPAMARLLLRLEWEGLVSYVGDGGYRCCVSCGGIAAGEENMPDARDDLARGRAVVGHKADCELVAVLRSAGVL